MATPTITKRHNERKNLDFYLVVFGRVDRATFDVLRTAARDFNGWYSRKWRDVPPGFGFREEEDAAAFADYLEAQALA